VQHIDGRERLAEACVLHRGMQYFRFSKISHTLLCEI
jgi:hypothetical protein